MTRNGKVGKLAVSVMVLAVGAVVVGCDNPEVLRRFNPCLAIVNCDPLAFEDLFLDLQGGVNLAIDPTCTVPNRCGGVFPSTPTAFGAGVQQPSAAGGAGGAGGGLGGGGLGGGAGGGLGGGGGGGFGT